jgi:hypothetical protein
VPTLRRPTDNAPSIEDEQSVNTIDVGSAVTNEVVKLAFEEARAALKEQDMTLGNLRNRATGLLAAASVGTSFAASVGFLNTDPAKGAVFPQWAGWTLLPLTVLIGGGVMVVLWPARGWSYGPTAKVILEASDQGIEDVRRIATTAMIRAVELNDRVIHGRVRAYQGTVIVILVEILVLVCALVIGGR